MERLALMPKHSRFLFNPKVTMTALVAALGSIAAYSYQIQEAFGKKGLVVCIAVSVLCAICAAGRSIAPAIDAGPAVGPLPGPNQQADP
jgi:hypothetical protein